MLLWQMYCHEQIRTVDVYDFCIVNNLYEDSELHDCCWQNNTLGFMFWTQDSTVVYSFWLHYWLLIYMWFYVQRNLDLTIFYMQKLSLLVTEAYKDAHQKSVLVRIYWPYLNYNHYHSPIVHWTNNLDLLIFSGHEGENEWSCSELRNAARPKRGIKVRMFYIPVSKIIFNFVYKPGWCDNLYCDLNYLGFFFFFASVLNSE